MSQLMREGREMTPRVREQINSPLNNPSTVRTNQAAAVCLPAASANGLQVAMATRMQNNFTRRLPWFVRRFAKPFFLKLLPQRLAMIAKVGRQGATFV